MALKEHLLLAKNVLILTKYYRTIQYYTLHLYNLYLMLQLWFRSTKMTSKVSQNHRISWVGKDSWGSPSPAPKPNPNPSPYLQLQLIPSLHSLHPSSHSCRCILHREVTSTTIQACSEEHRDSLIWTSQAKDFEVAIMAWSVLTRPSCASKLTIPKHCEAEAAQAQLCPKRQQHEVNPCDKTSCTPQRKRRISF